MSLDKEYKVLDRVWTNQRTGTEKDETITETEEWPVGELGVGPSEIMCKYI